MGIRRKTNWFKLIDLNYNRMFYSEVSDDISQSYVKRINHNLNPSSPGKASSYLPSSTTTPIVPSDNTVIEE